MARQVLTEALLLGLLGGLLGTAMARWVVDLIRTLHPGDLPRIEQATPDASIFAFGVVLSVAAGLLFGALPALAASRAHVEAALRPRGTRSGSGRGHFRSALVAGEVAVALVLATCAGLLLKSYVPLKAVDPGFATARVLTMQLSFPERTYDPVRRGAFLSQAVERIRSLPSVEAVGAASWLPLVYEFLMGTDVQVKGHPRETVNTLGVTPGYFQAIGVSLVAGRFLHEGERATVVLNEAFCKRYGLQPARVIG